MITNNISVKLWCRITGYISVKHEQDRWIKSTWPIPRPCNNLCLTCSPKLTACFPVSKDFAIVSALRSKFNCIWQNWWVIICLHSTALCGHNVIAFDSIVLIVLPFRHRQFVILLCSLLVQYATAMTVWLVILVRFVQSTPQI